MTSVNERQRVGAALWLLADLVQAHETRRSFSARAYRRAVWSLDELSTDLGEPESELLEVAGIGRGIVSLIRELRETGTIGRLETLSERYPRESRRLAGLPRMTPARLRVLKADVAIDGVTDLIAALDQGTVESVPGIGPATAHRWREILELPPTRDARPVHQAATFARAFAAHLKHHLGLTRVEVAGAIRRYEEWIDRIDLVAIGGDRGDAPRFLTGSAIVTGASVTRPELVVVDTVAGIPIGVHLTGAESAGSSMVWATGPPGHLEAIARAGDSTGIITGREAPFVTEEQLYAAVGMEPVAPPARGGPSTGPAARLVRAENVRGDLHLHTTWSPDGGQTMEELVAAAERRGHAYIAITDHAFGLRFGGLDGAALVAQRAEIDRIGAAHPGITILQGAELNIRPDGSLDFDDPTLAKLDIGVAAVHSHFSLDKAAQTARVMRAMEHPKVKIIAHLTGRRIGIRPSIELDLEAVMASAARTGTALEVNGHLDRLDLPAALLPLAREHGVLLAANSDAHRLSELGNVVNAVGVMQRAGVRAEEVVTTWPIEELLRWLAAEAAS